VSRGGSLWEVKGQRILPSDRKNVRCQTLAQVTIPSTGIGYADDTGDIRASLFLTNSGRPDHKLVEGADSRATDWRQLCQGMWRNEAIEAMGRDVL